jgi:hypothetical protein
MTVRSNETETARSHAVEPAKIAMMIDEAMYPRLLRALPLAEHHIGFDVDRAERLAKAS